jgi:hypothetical protein
MYDSGYYTVRVPYSKEQLRILSKSREAIQKLVSGTVLDLGCGLEPILGEKTICVDSNNVGNHYKDKNIEFHIANILPHDFFKNDFLKESIDYITMNAVVCNLLEYDYDEELKPVVSNLEEIINILKNLKKIAKNSVVIGEGEHTKDIISKNLENVIIKEVYVPENEVECYKKAYTIII